MGKRPTSITVIAWILIAAGGISLITSTVSLNNPTVKELMAKSPIPIPVQYAMLYLGLLVSIASGAGMLKRQNWARLLYVIWAALGSLVGLCTSPMKTALIPGTIFFIVIVIFLFRPKANQYFSKT